MKEAAALLNDLKSAGVITDYALFGAVAQMRYTEPIATLDADVIVLLPTNEGLDALGPVYRFCEKRGLRPEGEAIRVGKWPVQFIPAFNPLLEEAVREAETDSYEGTPLKVVSARHLAVIALSVGRAKDHARVLALLESGSVRSEEIEAIASRHGLLAKWASFQRRFLND